MIKAKIYKIDDIKMINIEDEQMICGSSKNIKNNINLIKYIVIDNFLKKKNIMLSNEKFLKKYFIILK